MCIRDSSTDLAVRSPVCFPTCWQFGLACAEEEYQSSTSYQNSSRQVHRCEIVQLLRSIDIEERVTCKLVIDIRKSLCAFQFLVFRCFRLLIIPRPKNIIKQVGKIRCGITLVEDIACRTDR
eukprot:4203432-Pyramimonas_sp.AAC.2